MNCIIVDDEEMSRNSLKQLIEKTEFLTLVGECSNGLEAINLINTTEVDLMFLDVEMPEVDGMSLLESLDNPPLVVLVTSSEKHAVKAFEYSVLDYLVKPIELTRFLKSIEKAKEVYDAVQYDLGNNREIFVKSDLKIVRINLDDILYVEALADYVIIATTQNKHIVHSTMKGMENKLPTNTFVRAHRSYIVNINKIDSIENNDVIIQKKSIPIGASYKDTLIGALKFLL
ncbi:MAG: LytTR family DNA-binding domain-containing protein [Cytophagales bacterium]